MTVQVVVMNSRGVAMASDSAITIARKKVNNTDNKMVNFSGDHSIGAMTYGNADLFNFSWDDLLKLYGKRLKQPFAHTKDYVVGFLTYLKDNDFAEFMDNKNEHQYITSVITYRLKELNFQLKDLYDCLENDNKELTVRTEIDEIYYCNAIHLISDDLERLKKKEYPKGFCHDDYEWLENHYGEFVWQIVEKNVEEHLYNQQWKGVINKRILLSVLKDFSDRYTGLVISGYGEKDLYPKTYITIVDGKLNRKIKYFMRERAIDQKNKGMIIPFAQRDMINGFLNGIHEEVEMYIEFVMKRELKGIQERMEEILEHLNLPKDSLKDAQHEIFEGLSSVQDKFSEAIMTFKNQQFSQPFEDMVGALPVSELAYLSESLLNLTALQQKMTLSMETAGGPVDVAVISKGDGFRWEKKKS